MSKRQKTILFILVLAAGVGAATHTLASAEYAACSTACKLYPNDTINIPADTVKWAKYLKITAGITLIGAGIDKTIITTSHGLSGGDSAMIYYEPESPQSNEPFRVNGITLNGDSIANNIKLCNRSAYVISNIRIDHCKLTNASYSNIYIYGDVWGLADNDTMWGCKNTNIYINGSGYRSWTHARDFGTINNFYIEDCYLIPGANMLILSQDGGRWALRYNTIVATNDQYYLLDMHGNQQQIYSVMMAEVYGNAIDMGGHGCGFNDDRGGQTLAFFNKIYNNVYSVSSKMQEEWPDSCNPTAANDGDNPTPGHNSFLQKKSNTYYFNNRYSTTIFNPVVAVFKTGTATGGGSDYLDGSGFTDDWTSLGPRFGLYLTSGTGAGQNRRILSQTTTRLTVDVTWDTPPDNTSHYEVRSDCCNAIGPDSSFFKFVVPFTGTSGCGAGALASMPAKGKPGTAYFATKCDVNSVSTENVGMNPIAKITGTLYKYGIDSLPVAYYIPYTYPHPFRGKSMTKVKLNNLRLAFLKKNKLSTINDLKNLNSMPGIKIFDLFGNGSNGRIIKSHGVYVVKCDINNEAILVPILK